MFEVRLGAVKPEYSKSSLRNMVGEKTENQKKRRQILFRRRITPKNQWETKELVPAFYSSSYYKLLLRLNSNDKVTIFNKIILH